MKHCLWCGKEIVKGRKSKSEYENTKTCKGACASMFRWNKCAEKDMPEEHDRFCKNEKCRNKLTRRPAEHSQAWKKRVYCSKSCAAHGPKTVYKPKVKELVTPVEIASGVKRYVPGSPEFMRIAEQYMARGM